MDGGTKNKVALVTGASSGIGEAIARELLGLGWRVIGVARSIDKLQTIKNEMGDLFIPLACDVSKRESIQEVSGQITKMALCPSLFFLNAGLVGEKAVESQDKFDISLHEKIMRVNYFGVLEWIECFEKKAQDNGGASFMVTGSVNAIFATPGASAYSASKAAITKAFEGLSLTYSETNLKFLVVFVGPVDTAGLTIKAPFTWKAEKMAKYMVKAALKGKTHSEPSLFYSLLLRLLRLLPHSLVMRLLK